MRDIDISKIDRHLSDLVENTELNKLVPKLLEHNVFSREMITRILNPNHRAEQQKMELYLQLQKRGPDSFDKLVQALRSSQHTRLASLLLQDPDSNSMGSTQGSATSSSSSLSLQQQQQQQDDIPISSTRYLPPPISLNVIQVPNNVTQHPMSEDNLDSNSSSPTHACRIQPFVLPNYMLSVTEKLKGKTELTPADCINLGFKPKPVIVNKVSVAGGKDRRDLEPYKMTSRPRGYLLIINNINFRTLPTRHGAENDDTRLTILYQEFGFQVISYRDKTRLEMMRINEEFAKKPEFNKVDCVCVCFMSHGQEGNSEEDTEILGVDEMGYKTSEIVAQYYSNNCPLLMRKPKLFIFQSCRGVLLDHGVAEGHITDINGTYSKNRTVTDGRKYNNVVTFKTRTYSDVLIAYPSPPGHAANRDTYLGAWFIQTIVDVFAEYACEHHIDNLFKIVDARISKLANLLDTNFQTVIVHNVGFSKHLYFNPGFYDDSRLIQQRVDDTDGTDVVDNPASDKKTTNDKSMTVNNYSRLNDDDDDLSPSDEKSCFQFKCNPC